MRIGIIDHHLANYHADTFYRLLSAGAWTDVAVSAAWEMEPRGSEDWCAQRGVRRAASAADVIAASDAIMVLAPDNFEVHRTLALPAVQSGKPVYVDKFLAPTLRESYEIVAAAEASSTPLMSSSALRFAGEVEQLLGALEAPVERFLARGMGNWDGYGVHTVAMAVLAAGGARLRRVCDVGTEGDHVVALDFGPVRGSVEVRQAGNQNELFPWQLGVRCATGYRMATVKDYDGFYARLIAAVVDFFRQGRSPTPPAEMLDVVAVLEGARLSRMRDGAWVAAESLGV